MNPQERLRIPFHLLRRSLSGKQSRLLRLLATAKLNGHRCKLSQLSRALRISVKSCRKYIKQIKQKGWGVFDGVYLFVRSWRAMGLSKRGGLLITRIMKNVVEFEALCFAFILKKLYLSRENLRSNKGRALQNDFPARYLFKSIDITQRRFERLKHNARKYRFISVTRQYEIVGKRKDVAALRKNLKGVVVFGKGENAVVPYVSRIKILI